MRVVCEKWFFGKSDEDGGREMDGFSRRDSKLKNTLILYVTAIRQCDKTVIKEYTYNQTVDVIVINSVRDCN